MKNAKEQVDAIIAEAHKNLDKLSSYFNRDDAPKQSKFKVGDYVGSDSKYYYALGEILSVSVSPYEVITYRINGCQYPILEKYIDIRTPKEGEFWYVETCGYKWIRHIKSINGNAIVAYYSTSAGFVTDEGMQHSKYTTFQRPASESEKQCLIKAVEEKYRKTFDGKNWVDMKFVFKLGDYVVKSEGRLYAMIYGFPEHKFRLFVDMYRESNKYRWTSKEYSYANKSETEFIDSELAKVGKRFNPETKELEDILKAGDLVIAWDESKTSPIIGKFMYYTQPTNDPVIAIGEGKRQLSNAIKWDGTKEQYEKILKE